MISNNKPLISEPKVLVTGVEGAGKTLFAVQQADLISQENDAPVYVVNVKEADPGKLPALPFDLKEMAYNEDGTPVLDELGSHLPRWATLAHGSVIIVDECHKVFPARGPGRPPAYIEMMAEGRQNGITFILLTQAPAGIDAFLRDRIHRHYHLDRKGNLQRSTIFEFDHCEDYPRKAYAAKKDAIKHFWKFPKQYYGWYKSAKSHHFKPRIPLKIFAALLFIPVALYVGWQVVSHVGGLSDGIMPTADATTAQPSERRTRRGEGEGSMIKATTDPGQYLAQFAPVVPELPWSASVFQDREVTAKPDLYCASSDAGRDALGEWRDASCTCITEQGTPYRIAAEQCRTIARHGLYNPYREPVARQEKTGDKPGEARQGPSGVRSSSSIITGRMDEMRAYPGDPVTAAQLPDIPSVAGLPPTLGASVSME